MRHATITDKDGDRLLIHGTPDALYVTASEEDSSRTAGPFTRAQLEELLDTVAPAHDDPVIAERLRACTKAGLLDELRKSQDALVAALNARDRAREDADRREASARRWKETARRLHRSAKDAGAERDEVLRTLQEALDSHDETLRDIASGRYAVGPRPLAQDAVTAREHLDAAWDAAHAPEDGMIPADTEYIVRLSPGTYGIRKTGPEPVEAKSTFTRRLLDPPEPAGAAEQLRALLTAYGDQDADADDYEGRLSVFLARHGARVEGDR